MPEMAASICAIFGSGQFRSIVAISKSDTLYPQVPLDPKLARREAMAELIELKAHARRNRLHRVWSVYFALARIFTGRVEPIVIGLSAEQPVSPGARSYGKDQIRSR